MKHPYFFFAAVTAFLVVAFTQPALAMYHPTVGRFLQRDPAGYADGMSLYEYVRSRPTVSRDASGQRITKFHCCDDKEKEQIKGADEAVLQQVSEILVPVFFAANWENTAGAYLAKEGKKVKEGQDPAEVKRAVEEFLGYLLRVFTASTTQINRGVEATCVKNDPEACPIGRTSFTEQVRYFFRLIPGSYKKHIYFCPRFFDGIGDFGRRIAFLHEISHIAAGTKDHEFNWRHPGWNVDLKKASEDAHLIGVFANDEPRGCLGGQVWWWMFPPAGTNGSNTRQ